MNLDTDSLIERVVQFLAEVESGGKPAQFQNGRARTLLRDVRKAMTHVRQVLEELRQLKRNLDQIVAVSKGASQPTAAT